MRYPDFRGVIPAITTPFREDLSLDPNGLATLVDHVIRDGVNGVLANGCTGESWALSTTERDTVFRTVVSAASGRVPVVAGCSAITSAEVSGKIRQAAAAGCNYVMVSPPWYVMPGPKEIATFYAQVLETTELPVLLYNIPRRTGVQLPVALIDELADHPNVAGVKESSKDWGILSEVIRRTRDRISVFAGFASYFGLAALTEGADGYMDSGTPVFGTTSTRFFKAATTGDLDTARRLQIEMASMLDKFFGLGTFPASVKAALEILGRPGGPTRPPIAPLDLAQREILRNAMVSAGLLTQQKHHAA
jgi:4-hydroxy-tetrahydrodipicolinate synthase